TIVDWDNKLVGCRRYDRAGNERLAERRFPCLVESRESKGPFRSEVKHQSGPRAALFAPFVKTIRDHQTASKLKSILESRSRQKRLRPGVYELAANARIGGP